MSSSFGIPQCLQTCSFARERIPLRASSTTSTCSLQLRDTLSTRMSSWRSPLCLSVFLTISLVQLSSLSVMLTRFVISRIASAHSIQHFLSSGSPSWWSLHRICLRALLDSSWPWKSTAKLDKAKIALRAISPSSSQTSCTSFDTHPAFMTEVLHLYVMLAMAWTALAASFRSELRRCLATRGMRPAFATSFTGAFGDESMFSNSPMCLRRSRGALALSIRAMTRTRCASSFRFISVLWVLWVRFYSLATFPLSRPFVM
mmetsp:Transcript_2703/g.4982  ORF Transcript_2703/g.4982 Transcript_2703/m.4982 type:complete len:259 (-) Transcript_2703:236-1012(-)